MRPIDEDTITQAVIARHAGAADPRLRELMTSVVQHLHAFARDAKLSEPEWALGVRFLADCDHDDVALLSHALGLTALVTAAKARRPKGCTEASATPTAQADAAPRAPTEGAGEPCYVRGRVQAIGGSPIAGAVVRTAQGPPLRTDVEGRFVAKTTVPLPQALGQHRPVGRLLQALGRPAWRPAHLPFTIDAPGCECLHTQVYRRGDPHLDADAAFGVRPSLVADWVRHSSGLTPDGERTALPFTTLDFNFVLDNTTGDTR